MLFALHLILLHLIVQNLFIAFFRLFWKTAYTHRLCKECHGHCYHLSKNKDTTEPQVNQLPTTTHQQQLISKSKIYQAGGNFENQTLD